MLSMDGKVMLVTGASRGVARGIAAELSNLGGIVYANALHPEREPACLGGAYRLRPQC
jgi:NAD(P)-dependent dehydrogenase (short-subunit alcohol dehydrogenase family)